MANPLTKKTSFLLLRTNPRLTTNVKLISDSKDNIFLESFDNTGDLSKSKYKGFKVSSGGKYSFDVSKFYDNGSVPTSIAYGTFESDDYLSAKDNFNRQYDFKYNYGSYVKTSRLYREEFACFAPLWIEPNNIPDYFVIFKTKDPVSVSTLDVGATAYDPTSQESLDSVGPSAFFENIIKNSDILKTVDLSDRSNIGKYIRSHANDVSFPESPLTVKWNEGDYSTWNGISFDKGGFVEKSTDITKSLLIEDKTIRETENFLTNGFERNSVICANILNMEFLFDDPEEEDFQINRYWGAYVSEAELGKFQLNSTKLFDRKNLEPTQTPQPTRDGVIGSKSNTGEQIQRNPNGLKMYFDLISGNNVKPSYVSDNAVFGYVKDKNNQLYSIKNGVTWNSDELRLDATKIDWEVLTGFNEAKNFVSATIQDQLTRSLCVLTIDAAPPTGTEIRIKNTGYKKGFVGSSILESGFTADNPTDETINRYTIDATATLSPREFDNYLFSNQGEPYKIAEAIAGAINLIKKENGEREIFMAKNVDNKVVIVSTVPSETLNELTISIFSETASNISVDAKNTEYEGVTDYIKSPVELSPTSTGELLVSNFIGANSVIGNKVKILTEDVGQFSTDLYLKTDKGYSKINTISDYLDISFDKYGYISEFKDFGKYKIIEVEDKDHRVSLNSSGKCSIYDLAEYGFGFVSFYPIRDFDNNLFSEEYSKDGDGYAEKLELYLGETLRSLGVTGFTGSVGGTSNANAGLTLLNATIGTGSSFYENGEFNSLRDIIDEKDGSFDKVSNEYDRLKENELTSLALPSRVIPFINKWVYDDLGEDVRSNPYRLSPSESFGFSNFAPSFKHYTRDPKFFTHEWYLLAKYPPYLTLEEKKETFSYFDEEIVESDLYNVSEDKYTEYLTIDTIGPTFSIPTQLRYSIFSEGSDNRFAETFYRGAKILIKDREENDQEINYNLDRIKFKKSSKYNGYRFSSILTFNEDTNVTTKVIKNDKFKNIMFLISADLQDSIYTAPGYVGATAYPGRFLDRSLLYTMNDEYVIDQVATFDGGTLIKNYTNSTIDGQITIDTVNSKIIGSQNTSNGSFPNFIRDIKPLDNGSYGELVVTALNGLTYVITGIFDVGLDQLKFQQILEYNSYDIATNTGTLTTNNPYTLPGSYPVFNTVTFWNGPTPKYRGGGRQKYKNILEFLSFANLTELVNKGAPSIEYITINEDGTVKNNDFVIEFLEPEIINKVSYLQPVNDDNRPVSLAITSEIGSELALLKRSYIQPISRYDGNYSPKFKDVITFTKSKPDFYNQIFTDLGDDFVKTNRLLTNTVFDYNQEGFGKIQNLYYNKVNEENPRSILESSTLSGSQARYPKINEIAIDKKDFYTFLSSWDPGYYDSYENKSTKQPIIGTRSMTEKRTFFGSKMMSLPDEIYLEDFRKITLDEIGDLRLIENFSADVVVSKELDDLNPRSRGNSKVQDKLYLDSFMDIALTNWLLNNGVGSVFEEFVNPSLSFGSVVTVDDDKIEYIKQNILSRYFIEEITFWEQRFKTNVNGFEEVELTFSDVQKLNNEYSKSRNFRVVKDERNDLRFRLIYNIGKNDEFSISMSIKLKKK